MKPFPVFPTEFVGSQSLFNLRIEGDPDAAVQNTTKITLVPVVHRGPYGSVVLTDNVDGVRGGGSRKILNDHLRAIAPSINDAGMAELCFRLISEAVDIRKLVAPTALFDPDQYFVYAAICKNAQRWKDAAQVLSDIDESLILSWLHQKILHQCGLGYRGMINDLLYTDTHAKYVFEAASRDGTPISEDVIDRVSEEIIAVTGDADLRALISGIVGIRRDCIRRMALMEAFFRIVGHGSNVLRTSSDVSIPNTYAGAIRWAILSFT